MKWVLLVCLATPIAILIGSGIAAIVPSVQDSLNNSGHMYFLSCSMHIAQLVVIMDQHLQALMQIQFF